MKLFLSLLLPTLACVTAITAGGSAGAEPPPGPAPPPDAVVPSNGAEAVPAGPVDVVVHEAAPPRRYVSIEWNPLPLVVMHTGVRPSDPGRPSQEGLGKLSANIVLAPFEHHAVILSPFYVLTRTTPITIFDNGGNPTRLPIQTFEGYGSELGYRYYADHGGLRGFFIGPSLIVGSFTATAENGTQLPYIHYGAAFDVGYQALVVDRVALSLGAGLQYTTTSKSIPDQMLWAKVFANTALLPRVLVSVGWAL
jgi:hypothetical protein